MEMELDQVENLACNKCQPLESIFFKLNHVIKKYDKGQIGFKMCQIDKDI